MPNRLVNETSPYLLQHAHNPVDWWPWGPEALEKARREDKPILLSVGYSACHWCHVMERESFEDPGIAAQMNRDFVAIKVDREERPDLDEIYMQAVQAFTGGHGGWPMTVFLTPDGRPFFGGTYFPPVPSRGMPSFPQVMDHAVRLWQRDRSRVGAVAGQLTEQLQQLGRMPAVRDALQADWLTPLAEAAAADFDEEHAGFGGAPKFPPHGTLAALLAHHHRADDAHSLGMALATLDAMAKGGMYDLLGGGFARYSVDDAWRIPHFEKMLYDNAQLVPLYLDAGRITGKPHHHRVVRETLDWVLREMTTPEGGFCAAQDADSEGVEGKFFVWTPAEIREVAGFLDGMRACALLQVSDEGSFEHGTSVLRLEAPLETLADEDQALLRRVMPKLFAARSKRIAPGLDDKVVAAWNGMMLSAMARAGFALNEPRYLDAARRAAAHLLGPMRPDGRLHRSYRAGKVGPTGFLDDYAAVTNGLVDLAEATGEEHWLRDALALADQAVALFWDEESGGFFFTGHDAEPLIARTRSLLGNATPSGNGLAALALTRLAALAGREDLGAKADHVLRAVQPLLRRAPRALGLEALAGAWRGGAGIEVGIVGPNAEPLVARVRARYLPFLSQWIAERPSAAVPWMRERPAREQATAYVCEHGACNLPTRDPAALDRQLAEATQPKPVETVRVRAPELPAEPERWLNVAEPLQIAGLKGQIVVLDFWTFCCINCQHVLPELAALEERFHDDPVVFIGVHSAKFDAERGRDAVRLAVARHGITHPVVLDGDHGIWSQYAVRAWPTLLVLDATGRIAWQQSGEVDRETLGRVLERLLREARAKGVAAPAPIRPVADGPVGGALRFPGKVHVSEGGGEPRLFVSDSGHHRVLEARLSTGLDGWPRATTARSFGGEVGYSEDPLRLRDPQGLCKSGDTLYVADTGNHAIRAIDLRSGAVRTVAGTGRLGRGRKGGDLRSPWDLVCVEDVLFIAMAGTHQIWIHNPEDRQLGPFIGSGAEDHVDGAMNEAALAQPSGLVLLGRYLFWVDAETSSVRMCDLSRGEVGTIAGQGLFDFGDVDGEGEEVRLQHPLGIAGVPGTLYVADTYNGKIKAIDLAAGGVVRTLCAGLREPGGLAVFGEFLIVADTGNHALVAVHRGSGERRALPLGEG